MAGKKNQLWGALNPLHYVNVFSWNSGKDNIGNGY
jgi:hypothetical protein